MKSHIRDNDNLLAKLSIFLILLAAALLGLSGCSLFEPEVSGVTLKVSSGTETAPGEVKITNDTDQAIYVAYIHYPYCYFFIYELERNLGSGQYDSMYYHHDYVSGSPPEWTNQKYGEHLICMVSMSHVELKPSESFTQGLSGLAAGKYRITVHYSHLEEAGFAPYVWSDHFQGGGDPAEWFEVKEQFAVK